MFCFITDETLKFVNDDELLAAVEKVLAIPSGSEDELDEDDFDSVLDADPPREDSLNILLETIQLPCQKAFDFTVESPSCSASESHVEKPMSKHSIIKQSEKNGNSIPNEQSNASSCANSSCIRSTSTAQVNLLQKYRKTLWKRANLQRSTMK